MGRTKPYMYMSWFKRYDVQRRIRGRVEIIEYPEERIMLLDVSRLKKDKTVADLRYGKIIEYDRKS